jgi:hypothetical protein
MGVADRDWEAIALRSELREDAELDAIMRRLIERRGSLSDDQLKELTVRLRMRDRQLQRVARKLGKRERDLERRERDIAAREAAADPPPWVEPGTGKAAHEVRITTDDAAETHANRGWYFLSVYPDKQEAARKCFRRALETPDPTGEQHGRAERGLRRLGGA